MTSNKLCSELAFAEGKTSEVSIGNIREIYKLFINKLASDEAARHCVEKDVAKEQDRLEKLEKKKKKK